MNVFLLSARKLSVPKWPKRTLKTRGLGSFISSQLWSETVRMSQSWASSCGSQAVSLSTPPLSFLMEAAQNKLFRDIQSSERKHADRWRGLQIRGFSCGGVLC